jgi:hypothetical protein
MRIFLNISLVSRTSDGAAGAPIRDPGCCSRKETETPDLRRAYARLVRGTHYFRN